MIKFDQVLEPDLARVTLKSLAKQAGVGTATVERVLNSRGGVRPDLVERVLKAARKLDYAKRLPEQHRGIIRIEILLVRRDLSFLTRLSQSFERVAANLDSSIAVHRTFMDEANTLALAEHIAAPKLRRSALIMVAPQHPTVSAAIKQVKAAGLPVVQLVSKFENLDVPYVGIDNKAAGRMAGLLMSGMVRKAGTVVALSHSQIYGVHRDRMEGFSDFITKPQASNLFFQQIAFTQDDPHEASKTVWSLMRSIPDLVGIYSAGGDYGPLCDMLRRANPQPGICLIGHELTEQSGKALRDGTMAAVIDQAPETQARRALDMVLHKLGMLHTPVDPSPIRFVTITAENL